MDLLATGQTGGVLSIVFIFGLFGVIANVVAYFKGYFTLPKHEDRRCWSFVQASVCFGIYLINSYIIAPLIFAIIVHLAQKLSSTYLSDAKSRIMLAQAVTTILNFSFLAIYLKFQDKEDVKALFKDPSMKKSSSYFSDFLMGIFTWFLSFPLVVAVNHLCNWINTDIFKAKEVDQVAVRYLKMSTGSYATFIIAVLVIIIAAPIIEEFIFRGCIQNFLRKKIGVKAGIVVTALIFAFMHFSVSQKASNFPLLASLFTFALYLGFIYEKTRSLLSSIILHMTFNAVSVIRIIFLVTIASN
ncbi:MAG: hypothetical protein S4CHLAM37_06080 [Chlamydiia bacterium]|nr:hypothetical protein [Chlamydiia bacterium]